MSITQYKFTVQQEEQLHAIAERLLADDKGILAADESVGTIGKRFSSINVENNQENRRNYRELLFTTPGLEKFISGVIVFEETLLDINSAAKPLVSTLLDKGVLVGIKVDQGVVPLSVDSGVLLDESANDPQQTLTPEVVTQGLDGLAERLEIYKAQGASFAKWRSIVRVNTAQGMPSIQAYKANAECLARYALECQKHGLVPIVEPEVLMDGDHSIDVSLDVTRQFLLYTFDALNSLGVYLPGIVIKTNFVRPAVNVSQAVSDEVVARKTLDLIYEIFPREIPGITFLSGGMSEAQATAALHYTNALDTRKFCKFSFSFGRALQSSCLKAWKGSMENIQAAQTQLLYRMQLNHLACKAQYDPEMESGDSAKSLFEENYSY